MYIFFIILTAAACTCAACFATKEIIFKEIRKWLDENPNIEEEVIRIVGGESLKHYKKDR